MRPGILERLEEFLIVHELDEKGKQLIVAFSGGLDSTVLLHACSQLRLLAKLQAVYIDHGLQVESEAWADHCADVAKQWGVPFQAIRIDATPDTGQSPEEVARRCRYRELAKVMETCEHPVLLTAQHRDDQAETLLLQLMRGAGAAGLAGMPESKPFANGVQARPLLSFGRDELQVYADDNDLGWVEDPSNSDNRYDRNFLRNEVMPLLKQRWPSATKTIARSAGLLGQQDSLMEEQLRMYLPMVSDGLVFRGNKLEEIPEKSLAPLLRLWLSEQGVPAPSMAIAKEIEALLGHHADTLGAVSWGKEALRCAVRVFRGDLYLIDLKKEQQRCQLDKTTQRQWRLDQSYSLDELGVELSREVLQAQDIVLPPGLEQVSIAFNRSGSKKVHLVGHRHGKTLKNWFQEQAVPPWLRSYCPLLFDCDKLCAVINIDKLL